MAHDEFDEGRTSETRRDWLARGGLGLAALAMGGASWRPALGEEPSAGRAGGLVLRNRRPLDAETLVTALDSFLTPNEHFFVRSHFPEPAVAADSWTVALSGLFAKDQSLTLEDLARFPRVTVTAVLQCSGNGRGFYQPRIPGVGWEKGAVGNAEWTGARLADVLHQAGIKSEAKHVHFLGADGPPAPKTPAFLRSIPIEKALHPDTLLITHMNGKPLPLLHGGPLRLIVPGWGGNHWMKWLRSIHAAETEAPGFYMQTGYRIPKTPAPPGAVVPPSDLLPVTVMNVKSLITSPGENGTIKPGPQEVRGFAWTGEGHVTKVEVRVGLPDRPGAAWQVATLEGEARPWAWRRWRLNFQAPTAGAVVLESRATDSQGEIQPETTPWNKSGYLWNAIDKVTCKVG